MKIYYTNKFISSYKKLPDEIKLLSEPKEKLFKKDPFEPSLKTHKLTGKLKGYWAFSINRKYRIMFDFINKGEVVFHKAGTHDIYKG